MPKRSHNTERRAVSLCDSRVSRVLDRDYDARLVRVQQLARGAADKVDRRPEAPAAAASSSSKQCITVVDV